MSKLIATVVLAATGLTLWHFAPSAPTPAAQGGLHLLGAFAVAGATMVVASTARAVTGRKRV